MTDYLTIDIGGTNIKYAVMDDTGTIHEKNKQKTPADLDSFVDQLQAIIDQYLDQVAGLAISVPGKVDTQTGTVYFGGSLTYLDGFCFPQDLSLKGKQCAVQNDGKAAALAEFWLGNLQDVQDGVALILGTGVGGGIILDGKLRLGAHFQAGEFSMMSSSYRGEEVEMAGFTNSAVQMVKQVNHVLENPDETDGLAAFEAIEAGHPQALVIFKAYCRGIAHQILSLQGVLDVQRFVIGGGISQQPLLIEEIQTQFQELVHSHPIIEMNTPKDIEIGPARFRNDANLYGALYTLLENQ